MARPTVADDAQTVVDLINITGPITLRDVNFYNKWTRSRAYFAILWGISIGTLEWARDPFGSYKGLAPEVSVVVIP